MSGKLCTKLRMINSVQGEKLLLTFLVIFMGDETYMNDFQQNLCFPFHVSQLSLGSGFLLEAVFPRPFTCGSGMSCLHWNVSRNEMSLHKVNEGSISEIPPWCWKNACKERELFELPLWMLDCFSMTLILLWDCRMGDSFICLTWIPLMNHMEISVYKSMQYGGSELGFLELAGLLSKFQPCSLLAGHLKFVSKLL